MGKKIFIQNRIQGILFDLGNTLSKSASLSEALAQISGALISEDLKLNRQQLIKIGSEIERCILELNQHSFVQPDWRDIWKQSALILNLKLNSDEVERLCRAHLTQYLKNCVVESYSIPLLKSLQKRKIPLVLVSNVTGPADLFKNDLQKKSLADFFETTIWSSKIGYRKPDFRIFQAALDYLNLAPGKGIVMVGNNEQADIYGGKEMGFTTIKVERSNVKQESLADYVAYGNELQNLFDSKLIQ